MTQTNPQTSPQPSSQVQSQSQSSRQTPVDTDALLHLHKMSTTAGLGSQEYVAVNTTAVVAVLFGVASLLAILDNVLLVIPIVGVVLSIIALRQIHSSNGTQTGRWLAVSGLALSALITCGTFVRQGIQAVHTRADKNDINALCESFGQDIRDRKLDEAYDLFDSSFKARVGVDAFKLHLSRIQMAVDAPTIDAITGNGLVDFHTDPDSGAQTADSVMKIHYKGATREDRMSARFRKADQAWKIDNIADLFPPAKGASGAPAGPGPQ